MPRYVMLVAERQMRWFTQWGWAKRWLKYLVAVLECILWVVQQIVKLINRCRISMLHA